MGSFFRPIRKTFKKVTKFVDKKIVEPLERPVKKNILKPIDKTFIEPLERPVKKVVKGVKNIADEAFEELIEKPYKKIADETFDVVMGTNKQERRAMLYGETPEVTAEVTPEVVPDDETLIASRGRGTRRSKRSGQAGTIMEDYGALSISPKKKSVEKA